MIRVPDAIVLLKGDSGERWRTDLEDMPAFFHLRKESGQV